MEKHMPDQRVQAPKEKASDAEAPWIGQLIDAMFEPAPDGAIDAVVDHYKGNGELKQVRHDAAIIRNIRAYLDRRAPCSSTDPPSKDSSG